MEMCPEGQKLYDELLKQIQNVLLSNAVMFKVLDAFGVDSPVMDTAFYVMNKHNQDREDKEMALAVHLYDCKECQALNNYINTNLDPTIFVELYRYQNESKN